MPRILVTAIFDEQLLARQLPKAAACWGEYEFVFAPTERPVDAWVVIDNLRQPLRQQVPATNTLLLTGEPASVRRYRSRFTGQFAKVWTSQSDSDLQHRHVTRRNEGQHWHYAMRTSQAHGRVLDYDQLKQMPRPVKSKLLSVICSSKAVTPDHRARLRFVQQLKEHFGDQIDIYGRGMQPVEDKADAIWDYRYHIVLENDHHGHFMTEKISDAFLGWSYPIYFGGQEAYHRFPSGSFTAIDIYRPDQAIASIEQVIASDTYDHCLEQVAEARSRVLDKNNIFAMLAEYWDENLSNQSASSVELLPKSRRTTLVMRQLQRLAMEPFSKAA